MQKEDETIIHVPAIKSQSKLIDNPKELEISEIDPHILLEQNYKFFLQFSKLHEANQMLKNELQNLIREKIQLKQYISKIEVNSVLNNKQRKKDKAEIEVKSEVNDIYTNRKVICNNNTQRHRRNKNEIQREFVCGYPNCKKSYGSEGSLNQHIKIKHNNIKYKEEEVKEK